MVKTTVEQDRSEVIISGSKKYRIRTAIVEKGELPQLQVFVFLIGDPVDPATDTFVRVGSPYDIQNIPTDRTTAIDAGNENYLSGEFTRDFDNLETAKQAKDLIYSRIDTLVNTWFDYISNFYGEDQLSAHPTADVSYEQQLKDTYKDAKDVRKEAETNLETANSDLEAAQDAADAASAIVQIYAAEKDFCAEANAVFWADFLGASDIFKGEIETFNNATDPFLNIQNTAFIQGAITGYEDYCVAIGDAKTWPDPPTPGTSEEAERLALYNAILTYESTDYAAYVLAFETFVAAFNVYKTHYYAATSLTDKFTVFCQNASVQYGVSVNNKNAKDKEVADAVTAKKEAEAELASAQKAEAAALAAVYRVCVDFDPASV